MRFFLRLVVIAAVLMFVFPHIVPGVAVHGGFWDAVGCAFIMWLAGIVIGLAAVFFVFLTAGIGAILVYFVMWFVYAGVLQLTSTWAPNLLTVDGWGSAIGAGLILLLVHYVFDNMTKK